jgi:glucose-6-phosphate 1-epimerase
MITADTLRQQFQLEGIRFGATKELVYVQVITPEVMARIYLQGAHLTEWQPEGFEPAILLSHISEFAVGKPIRGGIPVVFPWFAGDMKRDRVDGHPGPSHGFARLQEWTLASVKRVKDSVELSFTLGPTDMSRSMGYDHFQLVLDFHLGRELKMQMTVTNTGEAPLPFEEAFHTFFRVSDVHEATITGLETVKYIDKTDKMTVKPADDVPIAFTQRVDRVYDNTGGPYTIHDTAGRRRIVLEKSGSKSTIVWNPWAAMPDLGEWDWHELVAMETGNVGENGIVLAPGAHATMGSRVKLEHGLRRQDTGA